LVRSDADKSNGQVNANWALLFNDWINRWSLIDLKIANRSFTWSNHQSDPIMATLDRFLASTGWDSKYPLTTVRDLPKPVSDHTPLLIDTCSRVLPPPRLFRFEKWWLDYEDLSKIIQDTWSANCGCRLAIDIWQSKVRLVRKKAKGWSINIDAANKKRKEELL
jgi:hypothetical protein